MTNTAALFLQVHHQIIVHEQPMLERCERLTGLFVQQGFPSHLFVANPGGANNLQPIDRGRSVPGAGDGDGGLLAAAGDQATAKDKTSRRILQPR